MSPFNPPSSPSECLLSCSPRRLGLEVFGVKQEEVSSNVWKTSKENIEQFTDLVVLYLMCQWVGILDQY